MTLGPFTPLSVLHARRLARIAFGVVILIGVTTLWVDAFTRGPIHASTVICATWIVAAIVATGVWLVATRMRLAHGRGWWFRASLVIPALAIPLLAPLTLHLAVCDAYGVSQKGFDLWVVISLVVTGLAHVTFAVLIALRASNLSAGRPATSTAQILHATMAVTCVPFALLLALPPLLVVLTAAPLMPLVTRMERWIAAERYDVAEIAELPGARLLCDG